MTRSTPLAAGPLDDGAPSRHHELLAAWQLEEQEPFSGWDFSHLDGRMFEDQPPWSYLTRAAELMQKATSVVDLDTGGGERLLSLRPHWPPRVVATEAWAPNFELATQHLAPLGVTVIDAESNEIEPLPFADEEFDLVLNRHGAFNSAEVARILTPGGTFLTQQVHGQWAVDLLAHFGATPQWPDASLERYVPWLEAAGLTIVSAEDWSGAVTFADVGAIVYYLKAIPWSVPGFSVATYWDALLSLQARLDGGEELRFLARKYLIEARKE